MSIPHFKKVDCPKIIAEFSKDKLHRSSLIIPFADRENNKRLCVIGQNPSDANEHHADKTISYLEEFVFQNLPEYSHIIMLNLYSRIDTNKQEDTDLERPETNEILLEYIKGNSDFLLVYGAAKKDGEYDFHHKVNQLKPFLTEKNIFKIDIGTDYPPHPGNPKIVYNNFNYGISKFII